MRKLFASILVLIIGNLGLAQTFQISGSITGLVWDNANNLYYVSQQGPYIGQTPGYNDYVICVIDLGQQTGGKVTSVSSGSITLQLDGSNDGSLWTANFLGDVTSQNYQTQVNAIQAMSGTWSNETVPITLPISMYQIVNNKITIGVKKQNGVPQRVVSCSGSITATVSPKVSLNVTYNQGSGNIVAYVGSTYNAPSVPAQVNGYEGDQITVGALSPTMPEYQLVYNENLAPLNKSIWKIKNTSGTYTVQTLTPASNTFSMIKSQDNWTYEAQMKKLCNITFQNNFIGVGHGNQIIVNGNQVNSPSSNNMVVEQNAISAAATGTEINGIYYNLSKWTDANNNTLSSYDTLTFYPTSNMTYTANFIGVPPFNIIGMGYNIVVGQPITMHWTDNPNPNVTYQIWRNIKGGSGAELIATHLIHQQ